MDLKKPLPKTEISRLIRRYKRGDKAAGHKVVEHHLAFVLQLANRRATGLIHLSASDLFQEGTIGMMMALDKYRSPRGKKNTFLTYAAWWVRQRIYRAIELQEHLIRVPRNCLREMKQAQPGARVRRRVAAAQNSRLLNYLDDTTPNLEFPAQGTHDQYAAAEPDPCILTEDSLRVLRLGLAYLDDRERFIIERRFGLNQHPPMNLEQIGLLLNLTRERIRQIQEIALKKLRSKITGTLSEPKLREKPEGRVAA